MPETRASLLIRVRNSADTESWREFTAIYYPFIYRCARNLGVPDDAAQDVVQDVFMAFFRCAARFRYCELHGSFRAWLKTITRNKIRDWYRKQRLRPRLGLGELHRPAPAGEDHWDREHRQHVARHALWYVQARSDRQTWRCFEEHVLKGRKAKEVAAELNVTVNAVYINSTRTLSRVRARCLEFNEELSDATRTLPKVP